MRACLRLLLLLHATIFAEAQQFLPLNSVASFSSSTSLLGLPSSPRLTVSVAICSTQASSARFFLSNSTSDIIPGPNGGTDVFEIQLNDGYGEWSGSAPNGGLLSVEMTSQTSYQISVSNNGIATFEMLDQLPLLGDTTANQAILFSHAFESVITEQPSFPNYTLPVANLSSDTPTSTPNFTLVVAPTSAQLTSLPQTACSLMNTTSTGMIVSNDFWLRGSEGWRSQWLVDGLVPSTNYTAYVIQDSLKVSGPIYFSTKSGKLSHLTSSIRSSGSNIISLASFPCPLVHSLPYCPSTSYAVPLPPLPAPAFGYDATSLPSNISDPLLQYMTNFTTMLLTFACGRDLYSPFQTCADCQTHYRSWLCAVSFPRCSESESESAPTVVNGPSSSERNAQVPLSALVPQPSGSPSRNPYFPNASYDYTSLLPCLETCNAIDRACPYFLGIKCPTTEFNAGASYGVGFIDDGDGGMGKGMTGVAQDRWGHVWCNGI